jgi:long-chain acyl-CoA synthetase
MTSAWNISELLNVLLARGQHPAVITFRDGHVLEWGSETLAKEALRLSREFKRFDNNARIAIWAPNSPRWIAAALAVLAVGRVLVPIDDLADLGQIEAALASSEARFVLTTREHAKSEAAIFRPRSVHVRVLDEPAASGIDAYVLPDGYPARCTDLPVPTPDLPAMLSWTSGTTGSPKAFLLTHGNLTANVTALRDLALIGPDDRALLPLPLHHAYPFVVGMLTTLTLGTAIVLPWGGTGPAITAALRDGRVTVVMGVPRLYEALIATIESRVSAHGHALQSAWYAVMWTVAWVQRSTGLGLGRPLFGWLRRQIAPELRLLVSGGARLPPERRQHLKRSDGLCCPATGLRKRPLCSPAIDLASTVWGV